MVFVVSLWLSCGHFVVMPFTFVVPCGLSGRCGHCGLRVVFLWSSCGHRVVIGAKNQEFWFPRFKAIKILFFDRLTSYEGGVKHPPPGYHSSSF